MSKQTARAEPEANLSEEDILELLPWYAGGKTTAAESAAIEKKLSGNPKLQAELKLVRQEKQISVESVKALGEPSPALFDKIASQLDGARQLPPIATDASERGPGFLARLFGFAQAPALRFALIAAALVIAAESAALLRLSGAQDQAGYQTASAPAAAGGPQLIVQFQPDIPFSAVSMLLSDLDATIVKGPMPDGAFVIALQQGADVNAAMTVLKSHTNVVAGVEQGS
jgi:hypothetical protein